MVTGLVFLLVSGMAVVCGWQPMPDGSASYECVIQLEPELVSTLKGGDSIPLSVDVPDHVRPIKRVRIVVGSGSVPQQNLVTNLKPWPGDDSKESREGIVEAQYTYPNNTGDNRYASQPAVTQPVLPPSENPLNSQEAFARSLQTGGQAARNGVNQVAQDILPPDAGRQVSDAMDRTAQQMDNQVRNVGETVNSNIRQLFGGEPANGISPPQGAGAQDSQILPPGSTPASESNARSGFAENSQTILPPGGVQPQNNRSTAQPPAFSTGGDWQSRGNAAPESTSGDSRRMTNNSVPGVDSSRLGNQNFNAAQGASGNNSPGGSAPAFNSRNSSVVPQNQRYGDSIPAPERDSFDIADNRARTPANDQPTESGLAFPEFTPTVGSDSGSARPATQALQGQSSAPEIRRNMLNVPADAELQGANGLPIAQQNPNTTPPAANQSTTPPPNFDWNTQTQSQSPQPVVQAGANPAPMFPLLLSWVLLSGSGAGNLYLFWSYLDIRNKYRDVLYDASRKISGRHGRD